MSLSLINRQTLEGITKAKNTQTDKPGGEHHPESQVGHDNMFSPPDSTTPSEYSAMSFVHSRTKKNLAPAAAQTSQS